MNTQNQNQNQYQLQSQTLLAQSYNQVSEEPTPESRWCCCCRIHVECDKTETDWSKYSNEIVFALTGILAILGPVIAFIVWSFDKIGILEYRYSYEDLNIGYTHVSECLRPDVFLFTISPFMFITGIGSIKVAMAHRWARQQNVKQKFNRTCLDEIGQMFAMVTTLVYMFVCITFANACDVKFNIPDNLKDATTVYSSDGYLLQDKNGCAAYYYGHHFWSYFAVFYITMLPHTFAVVAACGLFVYMFFYSAWLLICGNYQKWFDSNE